MLARPSNNPVPVRATIRFSPKTTPMVMPRAYLTPVYVTANHRLNIRAISKPHTPAVRASVMSSPLPQRHYTIDAQRWERSVIALSYKRNGSNPIINEFEKLSLPVDRFNIVLSNLTPEKLDVVYVILQALSAYKDLTRKHYLQLLKALSSTEQPKLSDLRGLCSAIKKLSGKQWFTSSDLKLLLDNVTAGADIGIAVSHLDHANLLNRDNFLHLLSQAADLFYPLRLVCLRLPKDLLTQPNLDKLFGNIDKRLLAIIYLDLECYGLVNQTNLDAIFDSHRYLAAVRLMLQHMPADSNMQSLFTRMMNVIVSVDYILEHSSTDLSLDAKRQLCLTFFSNLDMVPTLAEAIRIKVLQQAELDDQLKAKHSLPQMQKLSAPSAKRFSIFQPFTVNETLAVAAREAQQEVSASKPKC